MSSKFLEYHHKDADLTFRWDGWMQILIRPGRHVPNFAVDDLFDIREPDILPAEHLMPFTPEALKSMCDAWLDNRLPCPGVRDFAARPWQSRSFGPTMGAFEYRYTGDTHIEIRAAEPAGDWRPVIDLTADGLGPKTLDTLWLHGRTHGWEDAWMTAHGIDDSDGIDRGIVQWTLAHLPRPGRKGSTMGTWQEWACHTAARELGSEEWKAYQDAGTFVRRAQFAPWWAFRTDADGVRWAFTWRGGPRAFVYSPDRPEPVKSDKQQHLAERPRERAGDQDVFAWLESRADAWIAERNARS